MKKYIAKRVLNALFVVWLVATVVFFGLRAIPGGPVRTMLGAEATEEAVNRMRAELGLDQPLYVQYAEWMLDLITLDLGQSLTSGEQISVMMASAVPRTLSIALIGVVVGLGIALPTGIISATRKGQRSDYVATVAAFLGLSMPAFFIGILLALVFGVWWGVLPIVGYAPLQEDGIVEWFRRILLPGISVGVPYAAVVMRMTRSSLLEVLDAEYMKTAKAKGVGRTTRLYKHAMQNALIPVVTVAGIQIALVLVGSVTVELVFGIQGIGRLLVDAILDRNYPVTQSVILLVAAIMVFMNLTVDIIYTFLDPRIRYGDEAS
ncbi:glutathione ABC transporter permease GsiC [Halorubrum sp. 48-1-W]|uniref:ABC transporter permease n=1 Tax=Halorubrum sp. 48-1-W TaxID=2249761 RepID=UPI000DCDA00E|nr:ABC transporter permease [Halorubrum sp. 48-1-W]RAW46118.1 glutathione ABC transporter permease GsiC [Halorubrum sp. 48-1-W]